MSSENMQREEIRFRDNLSLISPLHCLLANPYWNLYLDFYCLSVCRWLDMICILYQRLSLAIVFGLFRCIGITMLTWG